MDAALNFRDACAEPKLRDTTTLKESDPNLLDLVEAMSSLRRSWGPVVLALECPPSGSAPASIYVIMSFLTATEAHRQAMRANAENPKFLHNTRKQKR